MPDPFTAFLHQTCVCWPRLPADGYGEPKVGFPEELPCCWVWTKSDGSDATSERRSNYASVDLDREVVLGSQMWLGSLSDLPPGTSPDEFLTELMEVVEFSATPDIRGMSFKYGAKLRRFKGARSEDG